MKKYFYIFIASALALSSCIDDKSSLGGLDIASISVPGADNGEMPLINVNLGDDLIISPNVVIAGKTADEVTYEWSLGTYANKVKGELKVVGTEKDLNYYFTEGGQYYAHLKISDGKVGKVAEYAINVNRTFENGYALIANNESGKGNLTFVKIQTADEIAAGEAPVIIEDAYGKMNGGAESGKLLGMLRSSVSVWDGRKSQTINRLVLFADKKACYLEPNLFSSVQELPYDEAVPGFTAKVLSNDAYYPFVYNNGQFVNLNSQFMFSFVYNSYQEYQPAGLDDFGYLSYRRSTRDYNMLFFYDYDKPEVYSYEAYWMYYGYDAPFIGTGSLLKDQTFLTMFPTAYVKSGNPALYLFSCDSNNIYRHRAASPSFSGPESFSTTTFPNSGNVALPKAGTKMTGSITYLRYFYGVDNKLYVCLPDNDEPFPAKDKAAITFGDNEEITYVFCNTSPEELYIGTYDKSTKRGNFYIYNPADVRSDNPNPVPVASYKQCTDRIEQILYKPTIN